MDVALLRVFPLWHLRRLERQGAHIISHEALRLLGFGKPSHTLREDIVVSCPSVSRNCPIYLPTYPPIHPSIYPFIHHYIPIYRGAVAGLGFHGVSSLCPTALGFGASTTGRQQKLLLSGISVISPKGWAEKHRLPGFKAGREVEIRQFPTAFRDAPGRPGKLSIFLAP